MPVINAVRWRAPLRGGTVPPMQETRDTAPLPAVLAAFAVIYVVWGTTYLATRLIVEAFPPMLARAACCLAAGAILFAAARLRGAPSPRPAEWGAAALAGTLFFVGCHGLISVAQQHVASGLAALVIATVPLWIPLLDWMAPGGHPPGRLVLGSAALGFSGVAVLVGGAGALGGMSPIWGAALLVCALCWAAGTVLNRHLPRPDSPWLGAGMGLLAGGAALVLCAMVAGEAAMPWPAAVSPLAWGAMAYLVFGGYLLAFGCYLWLLDRCPAERVATYAYVNPLVAVLIGWLFAGETLTAGMGLAAALIVGAVAVATSQGASAVKRRPEGGAASEPLVSATRGAMTR
jgi:drug/metabolite transporter (DMT)-like permease